MKVLELFAGTRSIGKAFEKRGHEVFSVEWDKSFEDIDLYKDIGELTAQEILDKFGHPDVIWASPDCFPAGTLIWTKNGYKNVEDIRCFDEVLTHKNRYRKVYATQKTNKRDLYEIKISGCEPMTVSSEHPFLVRKKVRHNTHINGEARVWTDYTKPEWLKVSELSNEYRVGIPINNESIIPEYHGCVYETRNSYGITTSHIENMLGPYMGNPDFWWMVGRYFGDGHLSKEKISVDISCGKHKTIEVIERLDKLGIKYSLYHKDTADYFYYNNKELCLFLEQFGIGALNKSITPVILNLPIPLLKAFLEGYLHADGYWEIKETNRVCHITSISRKLVYGLELCILKAYGRWCSMNVRTTQNDMICGRKVNTHTAYQIQFYENYNDKRSQYFIEDGICWVNIRDVKHLKSCQTSVYNFSVEEDESYTANNIIVHNCTTFSVAGISHHRRKNPVTGNLDPISDYAKFCDKVDARVIELIKELNPTFYFIENPVGAMRKMPWMQGLPRYTITYCKYLTDRPLQERRKKPTDIWTNHPDPKFLPPCKNGDPCHVPAPRGSKTGTQGIKGARDRSVIPPLLCEHIVDICEE